MAKIIQVRTEEEKQDIFQYILTKRYPGQLTKDQKKTFRLKASSFDVVNGLLCFKTPQGRFKRAVFEFEREVMEMILNEEHLPGHIGMNKMVDIVHRKYYGIPSSVINSFVKNCEACARNNTLTTVEDIHINDITSKFDRYMMDCVDLRRYAGFNDGYGWLLNVMDTYTKYLWSFKMTNKSALQVKECLKFIYMNFGVPNSIQADNGKEFRNRLLVDYHRDLNVSVVHGRPRNPRAQGQIERVNQTIKRMLSKALDSVVEKRWIDLLEDIVHQYNTTIHRATNKSPFFLFHGQEGFNGNRHDLEITENEEGSSDTQYDYWVFEEEGDVQRNQTIENEVRTHFNRYRESVIANCNPNTVERRLEVGNRVLLKLDFDNNTTGRRNALDAFFSESSYIIIEILQNNMIKIRDESTGEVLNVFKNRLKKMPSSLE